MEVLRTSKRRIPCDYYACMGRYLDSRRYTKVQVVSYCLYTFGLGCALAAIAFFMASCGDIGKTQHDIGVIDISFHTISEQSGDCCSAYAFFCCTKDPNEYVFECICPKWEEWCKNNGSWIGLRYKLCTKRRINNQDVLSCRERDDDWITDLCIISDDCPIPNRWPPNMFVTLDYTLGYSCSDGRIK